MTDETNDHEGEGIILNALKHLFVMDVMGDSRDAHEQLKALYDAGYLKGPDDE